jgi:hypothetical protein
MTEGPTITDAPTEGGGTRRCTECAEEIQAAAKVCRFCGHRFSGAERDEGSKKSPVGAAVLSLVIPGLGHYYVGEGWRGSVFLISFGLATLGAISTGTVGPGWIIGLVGLVDAHRGAKSWNESSRHRGVGNGLWVMLGVVVAMVSAAIALSAHDEEQGRDAAIDVTSPAPAREDPRMALEALIREQLPTKYEESTGVGPALVSSASCTAAGGNEYACVATVETLDGTGGRDSEELAIDGTCDDRSCVWAVR